MLTRHDNFECEFSLARDRRFAPLACLQLGPWVKQNQKRRSSNPIGNRFPHRLTRTPLIVAAIDKRAFKAALLFWRASSQRFDESDLEHGSFFRRKARRELLGHLAPSPETRNLQKQPVQLASHDSARGKACSLRGTPASIAEMEYGALQRVRTEGPYAGVCVPG